jgi:hypothetical protein
MMNAMNETSNILALDKMTQEAKILMAGMWNMDPLARPWHEVYRERIGKEVMIAQVAATLAPMPVSPTTPVVEQPRVIDAQPPVIDAEPNVMKVAHRGSCSEDSVCAIIFDSFMNLFGLGFTCVSTRGSATA